MSAFFGDRPRWLLPVLVVVVCFAIAGGLSARELYRHSGSETEATLQPGASLAPAEQPGSSAVELTLDSAKHPQQEVIQQLLQTHFDAINGRSYEQWKTTVTAERVQAKPAAAWRQEYQTTQDGSILLHRIETGGTKSLQILVGFTSTQDVNSAPPDLPETCIQWRIIWPVTLENGAWKLDTPPPGTTPERNKC